MEKTTKWILIVVIIILVILIMTKTINLSQIFSTAPSNIGPSGSSFVGSSGVMP